MCRFVVTKLKNRIEMKRFIFPMLMLSAFSLVANGQALPSEKSAKRYFSALQTERVASSDFIEWHQVSPGTSGYCEGLWAHPTDGKTMIMSPDMFNTYGTWNSGESWLTVKDWDHPQGGVMKRVMCVEFSHINPDFGMAIIPTGYAMKSTNRGRSWEQISDKKIGKCSALAVDPNSDKVWYAGPGDFWNVKANHRTVKTLEDPSYGKKSAGYILKSVDGGQNWVKMTTGLPNNIEVGRIIVNPADSKEVVIATSHGIYKSTNAGKSWAASYDGIPVRIIRDLDSYYDKKSKKMTLFALDQTAYSINAKGEVESQGGVYKSTDMGDTWQNITGNLAVDINNINVRTTQSYLYGKTLTAWFGKDSKELKRKSKTFPKSILSTFNRIRVSPLNPNEIYISSNASHDAGFLPGEVWMTKDGGKSWIASARSGLYWKEGTDKEYWESRNNPTGVSTLFAHHEPEFSRAYETSGNRFLEIDQNGVVYCCIGQQMMRSTDHGNSWHQYDDIETPEGSGNWVGRGASNLPGRYIMLDTGKEGRILFCSGEHGLWENAPLGDYPDKKAVAVKQLEGQINENSAHSIASVAVDPKNPDIIYTIQFRQNYRGMLRRSTDSGKTWESVGDAMPLPKQYVGSRIYQASLLVDYKNTENIYFCAIKNVVAEVPGGPKVPASFDRYGALRSTDGGKTWELINNGFPQECSVRRLMMDNKNPNILYAALNQAKDKSAGGLYKTTDKGDSWKKMNIPSEIVAVNNIFQDKSNRTLYLSAGRIDGTMEEGGVWRSRDEGKSWEKIFFMPYIWQCESSPIDPNIITVNAPAHKSAMNCGAFVSIDGGKSWKKVNQNLGQPNTITDFKPDNRDTNKYWAALKGSGWTVGYVK